MDTPRYAAPLDEGIAPYVRILRSEGVETVESCEGGEGHAFPEPTIRFDGEQYEGFRALGIAMCYGLPVSDLRRVWRIIDGEPTGPVWEMTFVRPAPPEFAREVEAELAAFAGD